MRVPLEQVVEAAALGRVSCPQAIAGHAVAHAHGAAALFFQERRCAAVFIVQVVGGRAIGRLAGPAVIRRIGGTERGAGDGDQAVFDVEGQVLAAVGGRVAVAVEDIPGQAELVVGVLGDAAALEAGRVVGQVVAKGAAVTDGSLRSVNRNHLCISLLRRCIRHCIVGKQSAV